MGQPVMQWQILAKDPDTISEFYAKLFGWKMDTDNALNYRRVHTGSRRGIPGGIWPSPPEGHGLTQLFVEVDNVRAYADAVKKLGGTIVVPPQKLPDGDELCIFLNPESVPMGLYKPA